MGLSDKDEIAQLFKEHLADHKVNVDSSIWNGVSSAIGNTAVSSAVGSTSLLTKIIAVTTGVTTLGVGTYFYTHSSSEKLTPNEVIEDTIQSEVNTTDEIVYDSLTIETAIPIKQETEEINKTDLEVHTYEDKSTENETTKSIRATPNDIENPIINTQTVLELSDDIPLPSLTDEQDIKEEKVDDTFIQIDDELDNKLVIPELVVQTEQLGNQLYRFSLASTEFTDIQWELNDNHHINGNSAEFYFNESGDHRVIVSAFFNDEYYVKEIPVTIQIKGKLVNLPTIFTPDNDGVNDLFFIESIGLVTFNLTVFDAQRQIVFQTDDSDFKWDGLHSFTQTKVPSGDYHYIIVAEDEFGNKVNTYKQLKIIY